MNFWICKCNTDSFDLDGRLSDRDKAGGGWEIYKYKKQVRGGDMAFIWQVKTKRKPAAIRAICSIDSDPKPLDEREFPVDALYATERTGKKTSAKKKGTNSFAVSITYVDSAIYLTDDAIRRSRLLRKLKVLYRPQNQTFYPVQRHEAQLILEMIADSKRNEAAALSKLMDNCK